MDDVLKITSAIINTRNKAKAGFKLLTLRLENNKYLGDIFLNFCDNLNDLKDYPFSTILIGPNGTGKSNILRVIINIFRELHSVRVSNKRINRVSGKFAITYLLDGVKYSFGNMRLEEDTILSARFNDGFWVLKEDQILSNYSEIKLPVRIVANSMMITDKYPYLSEEEFPSYTYLGVRSSRNSSGTRTYVRRTVEILKDSLSKPQFFTQVKDILDFLGLEKSIEVYYKPKYARLFYDEALTNEKFKEIFTDQGTYFPQRKTKVWGTSHFEAIKDDEELISEIVGFLKRTASDTNFQEKGLLYYNLIQQADLTHDYRVLDELKKLDLITFPSMDLRKQDSAYNIVEGSSGEYSLLSSLIGLVASVEESSLVFVDEPEVSLHPNWQMQYLSYLNKLFKDKRSCHFIIATHSHFLISDTESENSQIIGLNRNGGEISPRHFDNWETFGWSAEEVLLEVFNVPTTRNYFVAEKLGNILDEIAKENKDITFIKSEVQDLIQRNLDKLSKEDPLKEIIDKLIEKYG